MIERNIAFRLEWRVACRVACLALIEGRSFEDIVADAVAERVRRHATIGVRPQ